MVGRDYTPPPLALDPVWSALDGRSMDGEAAELRNLPKPSVTADEAALPAVPNPGPWWEQFNDPAMNELIRRGLVNNNDLKQAEARIAEAQANEVYATSILYPQISGSGSLSRARTDPIVNSQETVSELGVQGTWELDAFGGNRRRVRAAKAGIEASQFQRDQLRLTLISDIARNYIQLRAAQTQRALTLRNLELQRDTLTMTNAEYGEQLVSDLEVARARAQVYATAARLPRIKSTMIAATNRISVLLGENPGKHRDLMDAAQPIPEVPMRVALGTPVSVIRQRPDVKAAERQLAGATELSGAAFAQLFPRLSLDAFFGLRHSDLYGSLSPWSGTLNALLPLLNFGGIRSQIDAAEAREQQALHAYEQSILLALEDVENNLTGYLTEQSRQQALSQAAQAQGRAAEVARAQYRAGEAPQLDLLVAQSNALDAESELVASRQAAAENLILLYRALGQPPEVLQKP